MLMPESTFSHPSTSTNQLYSLWNCKFDLNRRKKMRLNWFSAVYWTAHWSVKHPQFVVRSNSGLWRPLARLLDPQSGFINVLSHDSMTLHPQGGLTAPAASHQSEKRRDAERIFIHLSVSLFVCVAVATCIAIETNSRGSEGERSCSDELRTHRPKNKKGGNVCVDCSFSRFLKSFQGSFKGYLRGFI